MKSDGDVLGVSGVCAGSGLSDCVGVGEGDCIGCNVGMGCKVGICFMVGSVVTIGSGVGVAGGSGVLCPICVCSSDAAGVMTPETVSDNGVDGGSSGAVSQARANGGINAQMAASATM